MGILLITTHTPTAAEGLYNVTEECYDVIKRHCNVTEGHYNVLEGCYNVTEGHYNVTEVHYNVAEGCYNVADRHSNVMEGRYNVTEGCCDVAKGYYKGKLLDLGLQVEGNAPWIAYKVD